jgi:hypothetical protein
MPSEAAPPAGSPKGLPPVVPPTGKFLVQLFLVPGLIVVVALVWLLGFSWLFGSPGDPAKLLARLDNTNVEVRWRAASDLAQVLLRDDHLASDPKFALDLAARLAAALQVDRLAANTSPALTGDDAKAREAERNYIVYLSACLGNFAVPVGVPLLCDLATRTDGADAETLRLRHRQAVWALANLGENLKRFDRLTPERRAQVLAQLDEESQVPGERGSQAQLALGYLRDLPARRALGVDVALAKCATDADPFVRELAAFALNFWEGDAEENALMERTLVRLMHDDGHGGEDGSGRGGLTIRYNAVVALARRGSDQVRLDLLRDMLDDEQQLQLFRTKLQDGRDVPDQAAARTATVNALKAVADLHRRRPERDLSSLHDAIDALAKNPNPVLKAEAERTRLALARP